MKRKGMKKEKAITQKLTPAESLEMIIMFHFPKEHGENEIGCIHCADYKSSQCRGKGLKGSEQIILCMKSMVGKVLGSFEWSSDKKGPEAVFMMHEGCRDVHVHAYAFTENGSEFIKSSCQELGMQINFHTAN